MHSLHFIFPIYTAMEDLPSVLLYWTQIFAVDVDIHNSNMARVLL